MNKNIYKIERKITTLAQNAVFDKDKKTYHRFSIDGINFEHWSFNIIDGWRENAWLAESEMESSNFLDAINLFTKKLWKIVPRVAFISQCYIEYHFDPFIVHRKDSDTIFFRYTQDRKPVPLMFMEQEQQALNELLTSTQVSNEFFWYWNDAVNAFGYSAKLLLMFSALEALAKKRDKKKFEKPHDLYSHVLGIELANSIFTQTTGLRNRLTHGEYLKPEQDGKKNYVDLIHERVISFFNSEVLSKRYLSEDVINPQRNVNGNKFQWPCFVNRVDNGIDFSLKEMLDKVVVDSTAIVSFRDTYKLVDVTTHNQLLNVY